MIWVCSWPEIEYIQCSPKWCAQDLSALVHSLVGNFYSYNIAVQVCKLLPWCHPTVHISKMMPSFQFFSAHTFVISCKSEGFFNELDSFLFTIKADLQLALLYTRYMNIHMYEVFCTMSDMHSKWPNMLIQLCRRLLCVNPNLFNLRYHIMPQCLKTREIFNCNEVFHNLKIGLALLHLVQST